MLYKVDAAEPVLKRIQHAVELCVRKGLFPGLNNIELSGDGYGPDSSCKNTQRGNARAVVANEFPGVLDAFQRTAHSVDARDRRIGIHERSLVQLPFRRELVKCALHPLGRLNRRIAVLFFPCIAEIGKHPVGYCTRLNKLEQLVSRNLEGLCDYLERAGEAFRDLVDFFHRELAF